MRYSIDLELEKNRAYRQKIEEQDRKVRVSFHEHLLADYSPWWRKQFGIKSDSNLAKVIVDKCFKKEIEICCITNDPYWDFPNKSRFDYMFEYSQKLVKENSNYQLEKLGENSFAIQKGESIPFFGYPHKKRIFLNGQSIRVKEDDRQYEVLTFGSSKVPDGMDFRDTSNYAKDHGLLLGAEHWFAGGHHGSGSEEKLEELWEKRYLDFAEHDGKIAVPFYLSKLPIQKLKDFSRKHNKRLEDFAEDIGMPFVANGDSDAPTHIGTAYTIFDRDKINFGGGDELVQSLNTLIKKNDFDIHKGHLNVFSFMRYAGWILMIKDKKLGLREKYNSKFLAD